MPVFDEPNNSIAAARAREALLYTLILIVVVALFLGFTSEYDDTHPLDSVTTCTDVRPRDC